MWVPASDSERHGGMGGDEQQHLLARQLLHRQLVHGEEHVAYRELRAALHVAHVHDAVQIEAESCNQID